MSSHHARLTNVQRSFASLIFDCVLYWVLRQRFVLLHAGLVLAVLAYVACFSGLVEIGRAHV